MSMNDYATKQDLLDLEIRLELKFDAKLAALERRLEKRIDDKINKAVEDITEIIMTFMEQVDRRLTRLEKKVSKLEGTNVR